MEGKPGGDKKVPTIAEIHRHVGWTKLWNSTWTCVHGTCSKRFISTDKLS